MKQTIKKGDKVSLKGNSATVLNTFKDTAYIRMDKSKKLIEVKINLL